MAKIRGKQNLKPFTARPLYKEKYLGSLLHSRAEREGQRRRHHRRRHTAASRLSVITAAQDFEPKQQLGILHTQGCMEVLGYLFGRPGPAAEIPAVLRWLRPRVRAA